MTLFRCKPRGDEAEFLRSNSCSETVRACRVSFLNGNPRGERTFPRKACIDGADLLPGQSLLLYARSIECDCLTDLGSLVLIVRLGMSLIFGFVALSCR